MTSCKKACYAEEDCLAWQFDSTMSSCTAVSVLDRPAVRVQQASVSKNEVCARKLLHSNMVTSCKNLNERLNHKEVNRFWLDTICGGNTNTLYATVGTGQCFESLQFKNEGFCGKNVAELASDQLSNSFYANENDDLPLLVGSEYEFRIGNFRDGFSDFINANNQRCTYETFYTFIIRMFFM